VVAGVSIHVSANSEVVVQVGESCKGRLKVGEVLFGPFDLCPDGCQML
jgi:hypothetical protein